MRGLETSGIDLQGLTAFLRLFDVCRRPTIKSNVLFSARQSERGQTWASAPNHLM